MLEMFAQKILNPATGRWVKANGKIGQRLLQQNNYMYQVGGTRKQRELKELEGFLEGDRGKAMRSVLKNVDRILMTKKELRTTEDNKFMHDYDDLLTRYNYLIGKYMPEKQLADLNAAIYKYQSQIRKNPAISQGQLNKLITLRDLIRQQLGFPPSPTSHAPLSGERSPSDRISFREENDCPFELRPDTRQGTWCQSIPGSFPVKTKKSFWCCARKQ